MGLLCQPSRVCAVLQPSNAGLGVNQTEKEKGFGPNHSWAVGLGQGRAGNWTHQHENKNNLGEKEQSLPG